MWCELYIQEQRAVKHWHDICLSCLSSLHTQINFPRGSTCLSVPVHYVAYTQHRLTKNSTTLPKIILALLYEGYSCCESKFFIIKKYNLYKKNNANKAQHWNSNKNSRCVIPVHSSEITATTTTISTSIYWPLFKINVGQLLPSLGLLLHVPAKENLWG